LRQLVSVKPVLPLIPIVNIRQIDRASVRQFFSSKSEVARDVLPARIGTPSDMNRLVLVPESKNEGNNGALSLEPFEMSGLNFQVLVEHVGIGRTGEKKE